MNDPGDELRTLTTDECRQRIADAEIGRLAWADDSGTVIVVPVNFTTDGDDILFSTNEHLARRIAGRELALQIDEIEPAVHAGWSVLVHGTAERVDEAVGHPATALPRPWAGGERHVPIRLRPRSISGRRVDVRPGGVALLYMSDDGPP